MAIVRSEIKQAAKDQMKGKFWLVLGVILVNSINFRVDVGYGDWAVNFRRPFNAGTFDFFIKRR